MENIWNIVLYKLDGDKLISPKNNPTKSGRYLCTCVRNLSDNEVARYLQIMEYNSKTNTWHDCGIKNGISHTILAWTDKIMTCDFVDYDFISGGFLIEKEN